MITKTSARIIRGIWEAIEASEPYISTERLTVMTAEVASRRFGCDLDAGDVSEALIVSAK